MKKSVNHYIIRLCSPIFRRRSLPVSTDVWGLTTIVREFGVSISCLSKNSVHLLNELSSISVY